METALGVWARMRESGAQPTTRTYNSLLSGCVRCGQGERALQLLRDARGHGAPSCPIRMP